MGMHSKQKGKAGEREVRDLFRKAFVDIVEDVSIIRRNHQQAEIGGADLVGVPFYSVEVKRVKQISWGKELDDWWEQTIRQAEEPLGNPKAPCLVFRQDRGRWFVMVWGFLTGSYCNAYRVILLWDDFEQFVKDNLM